MNDEAKSTVDHILNSGPKSNLQAEGLLTSTDAYIAELSDHCSLQSIRRQRFSRKRQQRRNDQETTAVKNRTNTERQSVGPAKSRHHIGEILNYKHTEHGSSRNHAPSIET